MGKSVSELRKELAELRKKRKERDERLALTKKIQECRRADGRRGKNKVHGHEDIRAKVRRKLGRTAGFFDRITGI